MNSSKNTLSQCALSILLGSLNNGRYVAHCLIFCDRRYCTVYPLHSDLDLDRSILVLSLVGPVFIAHNIFDKPPAISLQSHVPLHTYLQGQLFLDMFLHLRIAH